MKNIIICTLILLSIIFSVGCNNNVKINEEVVLNQPKEYLDKTNMEQVINDYIVNQLTGFKPCHKKFASHEILGTKEKGEDIVVYIHFSLRGYSFVNEYFESVTGADTAATVELVKENGEYRVVSFEEYLTDDQIKLNIPSEYVEKALSLEDAKDLAKEVKRQAEEYLKEQGRTEKLKYF